MKRNELTKCKICGKGLMHTGTPLFYRIKVERLAFDMSVIHQQAGMENFFGGNLDIAEAFTTNENIANPLEKGTEALVCQKCIQEPDLYLKLIEQNTLEEGKDETS